MWCPSKKQNRLSNVIRATIPAHRGLVRHTLPKRRLLAQINHSWRHAVDRDLWRQSLRHRLGQHVECGFRGAVMDVRRPRLQAAKRSQVDDPALAFL